MRNIVISYLFSGCLLCAGCSTHTSNTTSSVRINQLGFYPQQEKVAIWDNENTTKYTIRDSNGAIIGTGTTEHSTASLLSGKIRSKIDLSAAKQKGKYILEIGNETVNFEVGDNQLNTLGKDAIRTYYYQRTGMPIDEAYAGKWHRPAAHPDTAVFIHPNAAHQSRKAGDIISSPAGWYDAGDYNKYIVNSAYTIGLILTGYQLIPQYYDTLTLNIPESHNTTPDLLDEMHYNLRWMLTMQDPQDGGVYHKLTTPHFEGFIAPDKCKQPRYVVAKSTAATLDFAANMAQASRIYQTHQNDYPDFSEQALKAALHAYEWAKLHPETYYDQSELNPKYKPEITTGEYGDKKVRDEFFWAACELYAATRHERYLKDVATYMPQHFAKPSWGMVDALGTFCFLINALQPDNTPEEHRQQIEQIAQTLRTQLLSYATTEMAKIEDSSFGTSFGNVENDFQWGCLADNCINQSISVLIAGRLCDNGAFEDYLQNAFHNMDYVLGRNATGYCYVTGFGTKSPMNIHHRLSAADDIIEPIPGFLVGGPNAKQEDKKDGALYNSKFADESYSDTLPSFASNEIAINWNASLVVLSGLLDAWGK